MRIASRARFGSYHRGGHGVKRCRVISVERPGVHCAGQRTWSACFVPGVRRSSLFRKKRPEVVHRASSPSEHSLWCVVQCSLKGYSPFTGSTYVFRGESTFGYINVYTAHTTRTWCVRHPHAHPPLRMHHTAVRWLIIILRLLYFPPYGTVLSRLPDTISGPDTLPPRGETDARPSSKKQRKPSANRIILTATPLLLGVVSRVGWGYQIVAAVATSTINEPEGQRSPRINITTVGALPTVAVLSGVTKIPSKKKDMH